MATSSIPVPPGTQIHYSILVLSSLPWIGTHAQGHGITVIIVVCVFPAQAFVYASAPGIWCIPPFKLQESPTQWLHCSLFISTTLYIVVSPRNGNSSRVDPCCTVVETVERCLWTSSTWPSYQYIIYSTYSKDCHSTLLSISTVVTCTGVLGTVLEYSTAAIMVFLSPFSEEGDDATM